MSERQQAAAIHAKLLRTYERWLDGEEVTAAQATAVAKYLKDNAIDLPADDEAHKALARKFVESLPFTTDEHGLAN